jgi:hypothetical protein
MTCANSIHQNKGPNMISMMDGFFGYNQVAMHLDDIDKTAFTTLENIYV